MNDRATLLELFDYTTFTWESYRRTCAGMPDGALSRAVEGSGWPALRNVFFHIATAWDGWLVERLGLDAALDATPESMSTWDELQALRDKTRGWLRRVIDETSDEELRTETAPMWEGTPAAFKVSVGDVVSHILLHERGHHGDVTTLLAGLGVEAPGVDFLVWKWFRRRERG